MNNPLKNIRALLSTHAIRLYELLQQYLKFNERRFKVDELPELMGLDGSYHALVKHIH